MMQTSGLRASSLHAEIESCADIPSARIKRGGWFRLEVDQRINISTNELEPDELRWACDWATSV